MITPPAVRNDAAPSSMRIVRRAAAASTAVALRAGAAERSTGRTRRRCLGAAATASARAMGRSPGDLSRGLREAVAALSVVAEHVPARARRREQHGGVRAGELVRGLHRALDRLGDTNGHAA